MKLAAFILLMAGSCFGGNAPVVAVAGQSRFNLPGVVSIYSATSVVASAGAIGTIYDWTSNNFYATQTTANRKPTLVTNALAGWPVIATDGVNNCMVVTNGTLANFISNSGSNCSALFVIQSTNTFGNTLFDCKPSSGSTAYEVLCAFTDGNCYADFGNPIAARISGAGAATNAPASVWVMSRNGANAWLYKNGSVIASASNRSGGVVTTTNQMCLFADMSSGAAATQFKGILAELIFLNGSLTQAQITNATRFLAARYNLTVQ